jgi:hypothetical protein
MSFLPLIEIENLPFEVTSKFPISFPKLKEISPLEFKQISVEGNSSFSLTLFTSSLFSKVSAGSGAADPRVAINYSN